MPEFARLLDAVHLVTSKLSSLADLDRVLRDALATCVEAVGAASGTIYLHDVASETLRFQYVFPEEIADRIEATDIPDDFGVAGQVFQSGEAIISTFPEEGDPRTRGINEKSGITVRTMISVPLVVGDMRPIGVVQLVNKRQGDFTQIDADVLDTVSRVVTLALLYSKLLGQNRRVASLEGMGRAAHDLANKAGVLVTFLPDFRRNLDHMRAALAKPDGVEEAKIYLDLLDGTFTDVFEPYSDRVFRYARLVNDLAAGKRLTPRKKLQPLVDVIESSVSYLATPARDKFIEIAYDLQEDAPDLYCDELYMMRIMENLVGNAIKAAVEVIPDRWLAEHAGDDDAIYDQVVVRYRFVDGMHLVEVDDHGPGLTHEQIRRILAGDPQVGWGRQTGSGLGTRIVLELAATHGGKVSIDSEPGRGSTFRVALPHRTGEEPAGEQIAVGAARES